MKITSFTQLQVWQKAHQMTLKTYAMTARLPAAERFGVTSQMQRAAVSVAANIAEGFASSTTRERARFYAIARSSAEELKYYLLLVKDLHFVEEVASEARLLDEVCAMLHRLREKVLSSSEAR